MPEPTTFAGQPAEWDEFVRSQAGATHYHLFGWQRVIQKTFGHECLYLAARKEDGTLDAVLPLVRVRSRVFGHFLVSMPFLNYGGPLGSDAGVQALVQHAVHMARSSRAKLLELRSAIPLQVPLPVSHRKLTVVLDLPQRAEDLWKSLSGNMRNKVRKPQKEGVKVRFGLDQMPTFWQIFAHHMRDLGTPTLPAAFFEAVSDEFGETVRFACAYDGARAIACGCGFLGERDFELTWSSALTAYRDLRANFLLHWSFMEEAVRSGVPRFNFGRSTPGSGTHEFKRQWGSRDEPLWWYQFAPDGEATTPSPSDPAYAWGPRLWKRLPLLIANRLGPRLVRYLP